MRPCKISEGVIALDWGLADENANKIMRTEIIASGLTFHAARSGANFMQFHSKQSNKAINME